MEGVPSPELFRDFAFFLVRSSDLELESMVDSDSGVLSFDPILSAQEVHSF